MFSLDDSYGLPKNYVKPFVFTPEYDLFVPCEIRPCELDTMSRHNVSTGATVESRRTCFDEISLPLSGNSTFPPAQNGPVSVRHYIKARYLQIPE